MEKLNKMIATSNTEQKVSLLPQFIKHGESGIDYLLECLEDVELEVRAKAYKLLQDVESEKVNKAIANGLLLNSGDKIYSVYEAGRWFTDESYIYSSRVDYLQDLRNKINDSSGFEKKAMYERQRICCYINKEIAEQEAERLHRQFIQKICLAVDDFNWKQENPDFKIKKWCIKNNINYSSKWNSLSSTQIEWEIQKIARNSKYRDIINKFNRHKYITIETWCHDNHVDFERSVDTFENYQNLLEYLDLPENIDLLSKFYKDGIAHFAFMKEEIVQKQVYLKTGEKLINRNGQNISIKLAARPENYDRQASNYLINILNNVHSQPKKRFKAYELLKEFNTPEATAAIARGFEDIEVKSIFDLGDEIELNSIRHSWDGNPT